MNKVTSNILRQESANFFFFVLMVLYIYLWLWRAFVAACGPSLGAVSGGHPTVGVHWLPLQWCLPCGARALGRKGSAVAAWGLSSHSTQGYLLQGMWHLPDQGSNQHLLPWQADSLPPSYQGSPAKFSIKSQIVNTVGFADHTASVTVTHLCCCGMKAIINNTSSDGRDCGTIKLYLQKWTVGRIWPIVCIPYIPCSRVLCEWP